MHGRFCFHLVIFFIINLFSTTIFAQASFQGLGFTSIDFLASPLSPDGEFVVGRSDSLLPVIWSDSTGIQLLSNQEGFASGVASGGNAACGGDRISFGYEAFYWTPSGGVTPLGFLPGGTFSAGIGISDNGQVVVGTGNSAQGSDEGFVWNVGGGMVGVGDLPGGNSFYSQARGVSGDGNVVVGASRSVDNFIEAFRWTGGTMVGLGFLSGYETSAAYAASFDGSVIVGYSEYPASKRATMWRDGSVIDLGILPGNFTSQAVDVSGDGKIVVGYGTSSTGFKAFIWDEINGIRNLQQVLETEYGLDLSGWDLRYAQSISYDGNVIVGAGINPQSKGELFRVVLNNNTITTPKPYDKWIAGETDTIKWRETGWFSINIKCVLNFDTPSEDTLAIAEAIFEDTTNYGWVIPDTLLSYQSKIIIENSSNPSEKIESGIFRIKPYVLTRVNSDSTYYAYKIERDKWGFGNDTTGVWPYSWWRQFNYKGVDPITGDNYPSYFGFTNAKSSDHPDWISFVNTFGIDACYWDLDEPIYSPTALVRWQKKSRAWGGSCFGIAIANALAFQKKDEFLNYYPNFPNFTNPVNVTGNQSTFPVINELFTHQFGNPHTTIAGNFFKTITPTQTIEDMKSMFREDNVEIRTLSLVSNDSTDPGAHTILAYKLTEDPDIEGIYYVSVYDNSYPNVSNAQIIVDTSFNNGKGEWHPQYGWINWGGTKWFWLDDPAEDYLDTDSLPSKQKLSSPFILADTVVNVYQKNISSIKIVNSLNQSIGFYNNELKIEIADAIPIIVKNGSTGPPIGYNLPSDNYFVELSSLEDTTSLALFTENKSFVIDWTDSSGLQTDRVYFDNGVSFTSQDQETKNVDLTNIINENIQEKVFILKGLSIEQSDSVKIENANNDQLELISYGSAKIYNINLIFVSETSLGRFEAANISLEANTTHHYLPNWGDLTNNQLIILVDNGNDGTIDDTLYLNNTVDVEDQGSLIVPDEYKLEQNYPNPFNPSTKIRYSIPTNDFVSIKVYNLVGEEVAALVNEEKLIGNYEVEFNAAALSSGVYFYRIQAGSFIETKKMIFLK